MGFEKTEGSKQQANETRQKTKEKRKMNPDKAPRSIPADQVYPPPSPS
jgi:hypothetical protein